MHSLEKLRKVHKNALIITAHPDDESLFMGGTIAEFKKWRWRILCVTDCDERYNKVRRDELLCACRIYRRHGSKVEPFMLGIRKKNGRFFKAEIVGKIKDFLNESNSPDIVFTHDKMGEYGHKTHRLVHSAVREAGLRKIYTFARNESGLKRRKDIKDIEIVRLSGRSFSVKKRAIGLYLKGSQKTNLSRLKRIVDNALNSRVEIFYRYY